MPFTSQKFILKIIFFSQFQATKIWQTSSTSLPCLLIPNTLVAFSHAEASLLTMVHLNSTTCWTGCTARVSKPMLVLMGPWSSWRMVSPYPIWPPLKPLSWKCLLISSIAINFVEQSLCPTPIVLLCLEMLLLSFPPCLVLRIHKLDW